MHAVGASGTVPLGWALYLPKGWCEDPERRTKAKIPQEVVFKTKPELGVELVQRASSWEISNVPVLGDSAHAENTGLRKRLHDAGTEYVLAVGPDTNVYAPETVFAVPKRKSKTGRAAPDRDPEQAAGLIARLDEHSLQTVTFRDGRDGEPLTSRFVFVRVRAAHLAKEVHPAQNAQWPPREEWLFAEWPEGHDQPSEYWISNLPIDAEPERLAALARLRWKIELDCDERESIAGFKLRIAGRSDVAGMSAGPTPRRTPPLLRTSDLCSSRSSTRNTATVCWVVVCSDGLVDAEHRPTAGVVEHPAVHPWACLGQAERPP